MSSLGPDKQGTEKSKFESIRSPLIKGNQGEPSFGAVSKQDASGS